MKITGFFGSPETVVESIDIVKAMEIITASERRLGEKVARRMAAATMKACAEYLSRSAGKLEAIRLIDAIRMEVIDHD